MDVREILNKINDAWLHGKASEVAGLVRPYFDDAMVMRGPGFQEVGRGGDLCANSYAQFLAAAVVNECTLAEPAIDMFGDSALATYAWDMTYTLNGKRYKETGYDVFAFARRPGAEWKAVWRAMLPETSAEV